MAKPTDYDKTHLRNMAAICTRIDRIYQKAAEEAAAIGASIKDVLPEDKIFRFDDYPKTKEQIDRLIQAMRESTEMVIANGVTAEWKLSNLKNDTLVKSTFGEYIEKIPEEHRKMYFNNNGSALQAFLERKTRGLNLSDRVWKYTDSFKDEIELGLDHGIRNGESAADMARSLKQYLNNPDKLFRRVRDEHGILRLSRAARAYHPGQGVYRSSYKNALRLAATETNMAYHTADHERWQQLDFVVGIEIRLSGNHPMVDICDTLQGRYPKDFHFTVWHPFCRCVAVPILKTDKEIQEDTQRILNSKEPTKASVRTVRDVPAAFKDWVEEHSNRIEKGGKLPYFVTDNKKRIDNILGIAPQKTPFDIAEERHNIRTSEDKQRIQAAWNQRKIDQLYAAIKEGNLPAGVENVLKEMEDANASDNIGQYADRIRTLQAAAARHAARTTKESATIQAQWDAKLFRDAQTKKHANMALNLAKNWNEVDYSALEEMIAVNNLTAMPGETQKLMASLKAMRAEERALEDYLHDVHGWHKTHSLAELKAAHNSVESTMDYYKTKFGADLSTDSNLTKLKSELEYKIKFVENPGKYKAGLKPKATWQIEQDAYLQILDKVETRISVFEKTKIYDELAMFSTTSKEFKMYMAKAKDALEEGDVMGAEMYLNNAKWKKGLLERARKGKMPSVVSKSSQFGNDAYSQKRKDAALWAKDTKEADDKLRSKCGEIWRNASTEERYAIHGYTSSYHNINEPLRGITYMGSQANKIQGLNRIPLVESIIDKSSYDFDMWLQRGDDLVALKKFGLTNWNSATEADIMGLLGAEGVEGAFWSAGVAKGKGLNGDIIFNIYAPKGTKAMYCEPFSAYGNGSGKYWNGVDGQNTFGCESEILIQRGTKFKITKIEKSGSQWYIDVDIIEQHPVAFPYKGGYPFK